ncbi:UNVERIFIED_CONTAM: hypothetical protein Sradi_3231300 [Sesamum radiatum]|uniref:Uncharacterized protein n=1 Tax=Sesamum radiatum TaxID=300843 RepID=A0AAW2RGS5_SESRA
MNLFDGCVRHEEEITLAVVRCERRMDGEETGGEGVQSQNGEGGRSGHRLVENRWVRVPIGLLEGWADEWWLSDGVRASDKPALCQGVVTA